MVCEFCLQFTKAIYQIIILIAKLLVECRATRRFYGTFCLEFAYYYWQIILIAFCGQAYT